MRVSSDKSSMKGMDFESGYYKKSPSITEDASGRLDTEECDYVDTYDNAGLDHLDAGGTLNKLRG